MTMTTATAHTAEERARIRAEVALAADVLVPNWPIASFIAVNPLGGLEPMGFGAALERAARALGARGHLPESRFRALQAQGRITGADLLAAIGDRLPDADPADALDALLEAPEADPAGPDRTVAEQADDLLGTQIAEAVDAEVDGWCAAFLDEGQAGWGMPDRHLGLYGAWRAIGAHDRGLRRLGAGDLRARIAALPERAEDALLDALTVLGVTRDARGAELRRHLGRRPGWASAIRWRAEHRPGDAAPADLTALLAIRCSLEALLVRAAAERAYGGGDALAQLRATLEARTRAGAEGAMPTAPARIPPAVRASIWQDAYERRYRAPLLAALDRGAPAPRSRRPLAQAVFCIDARSEGLRRHLERRGDYETLGFAGFFAVAISFRRMGASANDALCPVLLSPSHEITERPAHDRDEAVAAHLDAERRRAAASRTFEHVQEDVASPFALAEAAGWVMGPQALVRTLAPTVYDGLRARLEPCAPPPTRIVIDRPDPEDAEALAAAEERELIRPIARRFRRAAENGGLEALRRRALGLDEDGAADRREARLVRELRERAGITAERHARRVARARALGFAREDQVAIARTALTMMGLVGGFGRLVLLCGHGSRTENNPYEAALDCGACGGNQGGPNARVAAAILNRPHVRDALRIEGIELPEDTWFLAGQHDTAADSVTIFDRALVPASHLPDLERLEADLRAAGAANSAERLERLPAARRPADPEKVRRQARERGRDWAQIRPEWGLARNAAFIVGPRSMTEGLDLETRTFLHSYDWTVDTDASALETILTAPLVVAQWINCQYYFSTVDPERFGAGNKTLHNVVAGLGVLQGPNGDLQLGLPLQGVMEGDRIEHEPLRLLAIVQAPLRRIDAIIRRNPILQHLLGGEWIAMAARERPEDPWSRLTPALTWEPWQAGHRAHRGDPGPEDEDGAPPAAYAGEMMEVAA